MVIDPLTATDLSHRRRTQIQDCLMDTLRHKPYDDITVAELCRTVGISRRGFYYYFRDKDVCLCSVITRKLQEFLVYCAKNMHADATSLEFYILMLDYWKEQKEFFDIITENRLTQHWLIIGKNFVMQETNPFFSSPPEKDEDVVTGQVGAILSIMLRWYYHGFSLSTEEVAVKCLKAIGIWQEPS